MSVLIPFDTSQIMLNAELNNAEILESHIGELKAANIEDGPVSTAMESPIDSTRLREFATGKKTCTIITSDHTRPVPNKHVTPPTLAELREGDLDIDITLLVATGFHRPAGKQELVEKLGEEIVEREKIEIHDSRDTPCSVQIGTLPSSAACVIDRRTAQMDLLIVEGFIEPHLSAGLSGGGESVPPGVYDQVAVLNNHCSQFIASPYARTGVLGGNPPHKGMVTAVKMANLTYIMNVIIDEDKRVVAAFAGDSIVAHRRGCNLLLDYYQVQPEQHGDIVISSNGGHPLDQSIYQSVKGLTAAEVAAASGAVLIIVNSCNDRYDGENFYRALCDCTSPQQLTEQILVIPQDQTMSDQREFQVLCRVLCKHHVIYVTDPMQKGTMEDMKIAWIPGIDTTLQQVRKVKGENAHLVVIPNGISVMVWGSVQRSILLPVGNGDDTSQATEGIVIFPRPLLQYDC